MSKKHPWIQALSFLSAYYRKDPGIGASWWWNNPENYSLPKERELGAFRVSYTRNIIIYLVECYPTIFGRFIKK